MRMHALLLAALPALLSGSALAIGLDGPPDADRRTEMALGAGLDHVGGYGRDTYPFFELAAQAEFRLWRHLDLGGGYGVRQDLDDYNHALGAWRGRASPALVARAFAGYDGPAFHLSVGAWLYGARRDRPRFRATLLPFGIVRLRAGHLDRWHVLVRLGDGVPFTAEGSLALRVLLAAPPRGAHRVAGGVYTTLGENVAGLTLVDEVAGVGPPGASLRLGVSVGTDVVHPGRPEATLLIGLAW
jgi:hypothetical protein